MTLYYCRVGPRKATGQRAASPHHSCWALKNYPVVISLLRVENKPREAKWLVYTWSLANLTLDTELLSLSDSLLISPLCGSRQGWPTEPHQAESRECLPC